jgi:hypothetical protein
MIEEALPETPPEPELNWEGKPRQRKKKRTRPEKGMSLSDAVEKGPYHERNMVFDALIQWQRMNELRTDAGFPKINMTALSEWIQTPENELRILERSGEFTNLLMRDIKKRGVRSLIKNQDQIERILSIKLKSADPKVQKEGLQEQREWLTLMGIKEVDSTPILEDETDAQKLIDEETKLWGELTGGFKHEPSPYRYISALLARGGAVSREQSDAGKALPQEAPKGS